MIYGSELESDFFSNKCIVVTGGTGFVGSAIVRKLAPLVKEVHVIAREKSKTHKIDPVLDKVRLHRILLDGRGLLMEQLPVINPDIIFHCAEPYNEKLKTIDDFIETQKTSLRCTANILEYAKETCVEKFVHACSSTVYGNNSSKSLIESGSLQPDTYRGLIKLSEYNLCQYYVKKHGVPVSFARIFRAYGPYDSNSKLIVKILKQHAAGKKIDLTSAPVVRDYIHVDDIVSCMIKICLISHPHGEAFNIASGEAYTPQEIISFLEG